MEKRFQKFVTSILALGSLELFLAALFIFSIDPDPKNAIFLGYSASRWALFIATVGLGVACLSLALYFRKRGFNEGLEVFFTRHSGLLQNISVIFFIVGVSVILAPSANLKRYAEYFERLRPLLVVVTVLPIQFFIPTIFRKKSNVDLVFYKSTFIITAALGIFITFVALTEFGITPEPSFWNVAGVPLTTLQLAVAFLITLLSSYVIKKISSIEKLAPVLIDIGIAVTIYIVGVWIWANTPMVKHFNALQPASPAFQYFPYSDSRVHDLGAISIVEGYGIYFGEYTDKPLYMVFLSVLHRIAGDDYNRISLLHLFAMGLILPSLYWLGKQLHSRNVGIALAVTILIRQRNAIFLAHLLAGTNPKLLLTELPTMLGLIILCILVFNWIQASNRPVWPDSLLAGGIIGALSLTRLNPIGLLPLVLPFGAISLKKTNAQRFLQSLIFILGFVLVFSPWVFTGRDVTGRPYLWVKFIDVINVRYFDSSFKSDNSSQLLSRPKTKMAITTESLPINYETGVQNFPGFVVNHSAHNIITAFLTLPDSIDQEDQVLKRLIERPYFVEKLNRNWNGEIQTKQIPFLAINVLLLSLGLSQCWNRWKSAGIFPVLIFLGYIATLGFARNSGSRYIVPIDWIVYLYYLIGIIALLEKYTIIFDDNINTEQSASPKKYMNLLTQSTSVIIVAALGMSIVLAQLPILSKHTPSCDNKVNMPGSSQYNLLSGRVLYPYSAHDAFSFTFLTCGRLMNISIPKVSLSLQSGQSIIVGFSNTEVNLPKALFLEEYSAIRQIWPEE